MIETRNADAEQRVKVSIIMPAKNEAGALVALLPVLKQQMPEAEIIVVDDGSTDDTIALCKLHQVNVVSQPYCMGNGAAVKAGARAASGEILVFMDADGQHRPEDIPLLLEKLDQGIDMVVGARGKGSQASVHRSIGNRIYNRLASWMVGHKIVDLTSGFRAVRAGKFKQFLYLLPNGFSYPTTITMSFYRAGYAVGFVPVTVLQRTGRSHIRPLRDGLRFLLIIFRIGALYSPLKIFAPISALFCLGGLAYYVYTFIDSHRFTNMSALLLTTSVIVFLIGIVSEQITMLNYRDTER